MHGPVKKSIHPVTSPVLAVTSLFSYSVIGQAASVAWRLFRYLFCAERVVFMWDQWVRFFFLATISDACEFEGR
jgi:hypothetical protein